MKKACQARTAKGLPCRRSLDTPNATDRLCGLHALAKARFERYGRPYKWIGYDDVVWL